MNILQKIDKYLLEKCDAATEYLWVEFEITKLSLLRTITAISILLEIGYGISNHLEFGWRMFHALIPAFIQIIEENTTFRLTNKLQNGICLAIRYMPFYQTIRLISLIPIVKHIEIFNILIIIIVPTYLYFVVAMTSEKPPRRKLQYAEARGVA